MNTEPKVLSLSIKKKGITVTYLDRRLNDEEQIIETEVKATLHVEPHDDLTEAMKMLAPHYAMLTEREEYDARTVRSKREVEAASNEYKVGGVLWKTGKNYEGVMIHGHKVLSTGHACPALARLVRLNDPDESYPLADQLEEAVMAVEVEVKALLRGKAKRPAQTSITDPDQLVNDEQGEYAENERD
jgi:hypothetical protein